MRSCDRVLIWMQWDQRVRSLFLPACAEYTREFGPMIEEGIKSLQHALGLRSDYDDAMAYLNVLSAQGGHGRRSGRTRPAYGNGGRSPGQSQGNQAKASSGLAALAGMKTEADSADIISLPSS